jgi:hypothetical protein
MDKFKKLFAETWLANNWIQDTDSEDRASEVEKHKQESINEKQWKDGLASNSESIVSFYFIPPTLVNADLRHLD